MIDPQKAVESIINLHGGKERFFDQMDKQLRAFNAIWNQDAERIGRVLRAHLAVEHFLTQFLSFKNPQLPPLHDVRLTFSQKLDLLPQNDPCISSLTPGLRKLNNVRNRMAHKLQVDITEDDRATLLAIPLYHAMRKAGGDPRTPKADDPLSVLEDFSMFAASMLHSGANASQNLWAQAMKEAL